MIGSVAAVFNIVGRCGLSVDSRCTNQPNKGKVTLNKLFVHIYSCLNIHNKVIHFNYKVGLYAWVSYVYQCV